MRISLPAIAANVLLFTLAGGISNAESREPSPSCAVGVSYDGDDSVGGRLALALKERIRKSSLYRLSESDTDSMFRIDLVSIDLALTSESQGNASAVAVAYLLTDANGGSPKLVGLQVVALGTSKVRDRAEGILADLQKVTGGFAKFCK
jgi:hypothetical protein